KPCSADTDCDLITGKSVCDQGVCVQCTITRESLCNGKSCNPATKACTSTTLASLYACENCVADSECMPTMGYRCVPMVFQGTARPNGYCLKQFPECAAPYSSPTSSRVSLSGAASE